MDNMDKQRKQTLSKVLESHMVFFPNEWIHGADIEKVAQAYGYEGESGKRVMRDIVKAREDITKSFKNRCVQYKLLTS